MRVRTQTRFFMAGEFGDFHSIGGGALESLHWIADEPLIRVPCALNADGFLVARWAASSGFTPRRSNGKAMTIPSQFEAAQQVDQIRRMYQRALSVWASQLLELERIGSGSPAWTSFEPQDGVDDWSAAA